MRPFAYKDMLDTVKPARFDPSDSRSTSLRVLRVGKTLRHLVYDQSKNYSLAGGRSMLCLLFVVFLSLGGGL